MIRFLAIYVNKAGKSVCAMLETAKDGLLPYGVDEFALGLPDYDGEPVTLIEMPSGDFRPEVVDVNDDEELPMAFITLN